MKTTKKNPDAELTLLQMLAEEDQALDPGLGAPNTWAGIVGRLHARQRSALCLSGGGIRSAAFALGIVQALALRSDDPAGAPRPQLLGEFDYLSTVSGGGYLGSWFSAWAARLAKQSSRDVHIQADAVDGPARVI